MAVVVVHCWAHGSSTLRNAIAHRFTNHHQHLHHPPTTSTTSLPSCPSSTHNIIIGEPSAAHIVSAAPTAPPEPTRAPHHRERTRYVASHEPTRRHAVETYTSHVLQDPRCPRLPCANSRLSIRAHRTEHAYRRFKFTGPTLAWLTVAVSPTPLNQPKLGLLLRFVHENYCHLGVRSGGSSALHLRASNRAA